MSFFFLFFSSTASTDVPKSFWRPSGRQGEGLAEPSVPSFVAVKWVPRGWSQPVPSSVPRKGKGANKMGCVITDADWISSTASESRYLRKEEGKQSENRKSKCSSSYRQCNPYMLYAAWGTDRKGYHRDSGNLLEGYKSRFCANNSRDRLSRYGNLLPIVQK